MLTLDVNRKWLRAGWLLGGLAALNAIAISLVYVLYPGYLDHGEAAISAMAMRLLENKPVYLPFDSPDWITNLYGPVTYLWHVWPLALFGGGVTSGKIAAGLAACLIPVCLWLQVRSQASGGWLLALGAGMFIIYLPFPVLIRPDSLLTVGVAVAAMMVARDDSWRTTLVLGVISGLAICLKIHSPIYLAPLALYHVIGHWRRAPVLVLLAAAVALLPFASPLFPLENYVGWFTRMAVKNNLWVTLRHMVTEIGLYLILPVLLWRFAGPGTVMRRELAYLASYSGCVLLTVFLATKDGGNHHYFMPFLPLLIDLARRFTIAGGDINRQRLAVIVASLLVIGTTYQQERRFLLKLEWSKSKAVVAEIEAILDQYKDRRIQMGVGRTPEDRDVQYSYHYYSWRSLPVYRGQPYTLDAGNAMEYQKLKIPFPLEALERLRNCHTQIWLIPKGGRPFELAGFYGNNVFGPAVLQTVKLRYRKIESREFFDLWECQP
jgi:hypothetical protein